MQRWKTIKPALEDLGVQMLAISPDTPSEVRYFGRSLGMRLLSDESLAVADLCNVRHQNGIAGDPRRGIFRPLVIPSAFLIGADGRVKWIDQAEDYRVRSDEQRVLGAVKQALAGP